jgi:hypothetical protein
MSVSVPGNSCRPCGSIPFSICPVKLTGICVFYGGSPINGINTGDTLDVIVNKLSSSAATGTVTSVDLTAPSIFIVTGRPITTSGTISISLNTQVANQVFAGPTTGSASIPSFRALVAADLPAPTNGLSIVGTGIGLGGTLTNGITQITMGSNVMRFRDSTLDPGHNLTHTYLGSTYVISGDSTNNFSSKIELQDSNPTIVGLRLINNTAVALGGRVSIQMFSGSTANPAIDFMNNGNVIISNALNSTDDGTPIQIKGVTSHTNNVGIGTGSAITAKLHISAGSATAGSAPLKLTPGTLLSVLELGAVEFTDDGTTGHLYITLHQAGTLTRVQIV